MKQGKGRWGNHSAKEGTMNSKSIPQKEGAMRKKGVWNGRNDGDRKIYQARGYESHVPCSEYKSS